MNAIAGNWSTCSRCRKICWKIATKLQLHLTGREAAGLTKRYTSNVEAYRNYMLGRQLAQPRTPAGLQNAVGYYEQAIALDSHYALAFAGLTDAYTNLANRGVVPLKEGRERLEPPRAWQRASSIPTWQRHTRQLADSRLRGAV